MMAVEWFYATAGTRSGPHTEAEMLSFVDEGKVSDDTLCWQTAYGVDWKPYVKTELRSARQAAADPSEPPPLPPSHISNFWAYTIATVPLVGGIIEEIIGVAVQRPISTFFFGLVCSPPPDF